MFQKERLHLPAGQAASPEQYVFPRGVIAHGGLPHSGNPNTLALLSQA